MNGAEAAAGQNEFPTDLRITPAHVTEQFDLLLGMRREIRMAAFGGHNAVAGAVPNENGLAQAGAGGEKRARAAVLGLAGIQDAIFFGSEMFNAVAGSAKIVHEHNVGKFQFAGKDGGVHGPWEIGGANAIINDRAGHAKAGGANLFFCEMRRRLKGKLANDQVKLSEVFAREALLEDGSELAAFLGEESKIAFRAAYVTRKNHRMPPSSCRSL